MAAPRSTLGQSTVPTHYPDGQPIPPTEQLMQLDQAITLTLQEIDANFARAHQTITNRILPAVKRYGVASAQTWQGAKVRAEYGAFSESCLDGAYMQPQSGIVPCPAERDSHKKSRLPRR